MAVDRVLTTVLFTDIVDSTELASRLGDERWGKLLDRHNQLVRKELNRFGGREVKTTGDGFLAMFDGPARAIRCAEATQAALKSIGLRERFGVHTGECDVVGTDVAGVSAHIASRVAALSNGENVVVTSTLKDLVTGSGIAFRELGTYSLKGVEGSWRLYEVDHGTN